MPSTRQSADKCYHGPITKHGKGHARWMLVQAPQHIDLHPGPLGDLFRRIAKRKNRNVAVVATARKLVSIAWHMLKNNEPYRYADPNPTKAINALGDSSYPALSLTRPKTTSTFQLT